MNASFVTALTAARQLLKARQWQLALPLLHDALSRAPHRAAEADVQALLGRACARLRDWPAARSWLERALAEGAPTAYAHSAPLLHQLGRACQEVGDREAARQAYQQALTHKRLAGLDAAMGQTYHQLGRVYETGQDYAEAERAYQQAITWMKQHDQSHLGLSLFQLGKVQEAQHKPLQAVDTYTHAVAALNAYPGLKAEAYYRIGVLFVSFQRPAEARLAFEQALATYQEQKQSFWIGMTQLKLGLLALAQGQIPQVMQHAREAVQALEKSPDTQALQMAYDLLTELSQLLGQTDEVHNWQARSAALQQTVSEQNTD